MGWFLSSKSKGRKGTSRGGKKTKKPPLEGKGWDPMRTLANMWLMSWTLLLLVGAGAWYFGEGYLMAYVSEKHRDKPVTVELIDPPGWMHERLTEHLRTQVELIVDADPFDRQALAQAARALDRKPWIKRVDRIMRTAPGRIEVQATYRRPTALIRAEDGYHLVDREGVRLPGRYPADRIAETGLAVIQGVSAPPPAAGQAWRGDDVQAGLMLAGMLREVAWANDVAAIDVHNYSGRVDIGSPHIVMPTVYGGVLRWGRAIGEEQFHEPPAETKLRHVQRVRRQARTICANGRIVDIFHDTINIHQARAEEGNSDNARTGAARPAGPGAERGAGGGAGVTARQALHSHE